MCPRENVGGRLSCGTDLFVDGPDEVCSSDGWTLDGARASLGRGQLGGGGHVPYSYPGGAGAGGRVEAGQQHPLQPTPAPAHVDLQKEVALQLVLALIPCRQCRCNCSLIFLG